MLIMRRRVGESILVGDGVEIEILEVTGTRVRLGISAPESVTIIRKETQLTRTENLNAAKSVNRDAISALVSRLSR